MISISQVNRDRPLCEYRKKRENAWREWVEETRRNEDVSCEPVLKQEEVNALHPACIQYG